MGKREGGGRGGQREGGHLALCEFEGDIVATVDAFRYVGADRRDGRRRRVEQRTADL